MNEKTIKALFEFIEICGHCDKEFDFTLNMVPALRCPHCGNITPSCSVCLANNCPECDINMSGFESQINKEQNND